MDRPSIYENGTYLENNPDWHEQDSPWKARQIRKMLDKHGIAPAKVAEIGCGAGEILNCLAHEQADAVFYGYDISPQAFDICKRKERPNLRFFMKDMLDEEGCDYDVILAIDVFEHIEDYFSFLRKLKGKGTYKIFHIPLDLSVQSVLRATPIIKARSTIGHIHYFTKETALASLRDTGYEIVDHFYTSSSLELPNRGWKADLMKLPRKMFFSLNQDLAARALGGFSLLVLTR